MSGTSMAAPNATGTLALLVQHYRNLYGAGINPLSATIKGLAIHSAFDAGNKGPDYVYGWGVLDAAAAAAFLTNTTNPFS
jgi:subtilisin family serine protease